MSSAGRAPRVSIAVPVYNGERYLRESLDGLLAQTFTDFELVISDNASTDGTEAICREYVARDPRVRYHRNAVNIGGPGNFRRAFRLSRGEYHKWSTADDLWHPTFVEKCVAVLDARPDVVLAYPRSNIVDANGAVVRTFDDPLDLPEESGVERLRRVIQESTLCHAHLGVIRRSAMLNTGLIGSELASDIRFLAEMAMLGKFAVVPEYLFGRRFHEASSSWAREDAEWQRQYYAPGRAGVARFGMWRRYLHLLLRAARVPLPLAARWDLLRFLGRRMRWQRGQLLQELIQSTVHPRGATVVHPR
jgi:glycosyltransferase involved in cell wall biosynthesis